ncbi:MAG: phospholipase D-like domain-containing protein [Opitutales bacterium]
MAVFLESGRFVRSATLALLTAAAALAAEQAGLLRDDVMLAVRIGCQAYVALRLARARTSPAYLLLWGPLAWYLPVGTALAFFLLGGRKHTALAESKKEINRMARGLGDGPRFDGNRFMLLGDQHGLDTLRELRRLIKGAARRISVSTYILADDAVGRELIRLLAARAKEGVEVRLLVDAVGSFGIPLRLCGQLRRAGGRVARFNPVLPTRGKGSANWRNHRKIAVFDGTTAIIGGQNLGLRYMGDRPWSRRYRDCSFLIEGPSAAAIEHVFLADWCQATDESPSDFRAQLDERPDAAGRTRVEVIASGPDCEGDPLWETYERLFSNCRRSITVVTPYFVPDRTLFTLLVSAARAGRHVKVMVPRRSDHRLLDFARRWRLRTLSEAGAEILFFKPDMLHAKITVVDDEHLIVGSGNLDMRSLFLNYEIGALIRDPQALAETLSLVSAWEAECGRVTDDLRRGVRPLAERLLEAASKVASPFL